MTVVSNPPRPDNALQTIIQPSSPPELRIPHYVDVPNVLVSTRLGPKPPKPDLLAKPNAPKDIGKQLAAPRVQAEMPFPVPQLSTENPRLPVPISSAPLAPTQPGQANAYGAAAGAGGAGEDGESHLLVLNAMPGGASDLLRLPPGNRYGAFTISPDGGWPGSPGGVKGGDLLGGGGGEGTGGDGSSGVGGGGSGGGGGSTGGNVPVSVAGGNGPGGAGAWGALAARVMPGQIFPVLAPVRLPRQALVVSTGPIGGGGLRVYGVLKGNKIYTKYIPMPGKHWILQYCARENPAPKPLPKGRGVAATAFDQSVVAPEAEEKFDFGRLPVPPDKTDEMIVLHGIIREDGSFVGLRIMQGILEEMDRVALDAFGRWKFKPALQHGKPVAVEILVGIPPVVPPPQS